MFTSRKPEAKRFRKWVTSEVLPEIRKTGGYGRPETQFAGLSGERVEYERWLLERALLDAQLIAPGMQSIGVHFERMVTDDPEFGAARARAEIRSGCVAEGEFSGLIPAGLEVVLAFVPLEEAGAALQDGDETGDGALGQFSQRGLQLGYRHLDGVEVRAVGRQVSHRAVFPGQDFRHSRASCEP